MSDYGMSRKEVVKEVATKAGVSQVVAKAVIEKYEETLEAGAKRDGVIKLGELGLFHVKAVDATVRRNPRTGEAIQRPAYNKVSFKPSATLKRRVNE